MQQKIEFSQIRNLGEIVDDSITFLKQNWKPLFKAYFTISGFFWAAGIIIAGFNQTRTFQLQAAGESIFSITYFLTILFGFINFIFVLLTTLSFMTLYNEKGKEAPGVEEVWGYFKYYFFRVSGSLFLLVLLVSAGLVLCIIPGIYLMPVILLIITIMVFENAGLTYAFNHGFQLIKGNWWQLFCVLIVTTIILAAAMVLLAIPVGIIVFLILLLTSLNHENTILTALSLTFSAFQVLYLLPVISIVLSYFSFNQQKDDNSIMQRIEMLGKNNQPADQVPSEEY